jgi:hypothetical protein
MIYLLIAIIILLSLTIVVLSVNFRKAQLSHHKKVGELQFTLVQMTADNNDTRVRLELSESLKSTLRLAREKIDRDVMAIQHDLVETLAKNNLI